MDTLNNMPTKNKLLLLGVLPPVILLIAQVLAGAGNLVVQLSVAAIIVGIAAFTAIGMGSQIENTLRKAREAISGMANGDYSIALPDKDQSDVGQLTFALSNLQRALMQQKVAAENSNDVRLLKALEVCDTNIMVADKDLNIVYLNKSVTDMLTKAESDIRKELPNFSAQNLVGANADIFHKNPAHQRRMISTLKETHRAQITVGGRTFSLLATPLFDKSGQFNGTVVEWKDRTDELAKAERMDKQAAENLRIRQALDYCDTSVMLADNDMNIIYMNGAVTKMMEHREKELRSALPSFDARNLLGSNVDRFHVNPAHQRNMLKDLRQPHQTKIKVSGLTFSLIATPLFDQNRERIGTIIEWKDLTEALAIEERLAQEAATNLRIKQALDNVTTNTMIGDADNNIVYANSSWFSMMSKAESDVRKDLPNFSTRSVIGSNMDIFHKNPAHQKHMIERLSGTHKAQINVGGRTFRLIANPIIDDQGKRIGTVVEWADRTDEVSIEREIDAMVAAASRGDFTQTIDMTGKEGFFKTLSMGLNQLMSTTEVGINDVLRMLGAIAKGNLTEKITRDYEGAFGQLKRDANGTAEKLTEIIGNIRHATAMITTAANEIAQGNADLSQRTEEQASSLEETASSMEEMTSAVKQSAENARQANTLAKEAQIKASQGGDVVQRAVRAMDEINSSSKRIADIIGVIDEIAFQTNLLALNAAVEAARAGEQGRGFAVVAGEVRNLAQRSAAAAKEIKDLIRDSVTKVEDGSVLVNESGMTLRDIVDSVEKVSVMMREIADAAQEQTSGIEQVNTAVAQMDEMTQQNAALVEEASAAGEAMAEQANALNSMMDFFFIEGAALQGPVGLGKRNVSVVSRSAPTVAAALPSGKGVSVDDDEWEEF